MYRTLIGCEPLHSAVNDAEWVVVDCRFELGSPDDGRQAYLAGHIPGAVYVHLDDDLSAPKAPGRGRHPLPSAEHLSALFGRLGITAGKQVVAYDAMGGMMAAARFWWLLRYMGHEAVAVLDGGWPAWVAAGLPACTGEEHRARAEFIGRPYADRVVSPDQVLRQPRLIDSRDPARFRGETEPVDPVAGHIPGAVNHFCKNNLDEQGRFRDTASLRRLLQPAFGAAAPGEVTFYCGSGVTACHNILAAVHAGFNEPRLYAGSWSEWCADPVRPVARGEAG